MNEVVNKTRVERELERKAESKIEKEVGKSEVETKKEKGKEKIGEKSKSGREKDYKNPPREEKSKKEEKNKESLLVSPKEVRRVLLAKREPLYALPTNMLLHASSSLVSLPTGCLLQRCTSGLPSLRGIEHHIDLTLGTTFPNRASYRMNPKEAKEIQKQVGKLLEKGRVRESMSLCVMLVILVPKKDGTWRICTDCRPINNIIVRYGYPIPHLDEFLDELHEWVPLNKDEEGDEWKTTFKTKFGLYEWLVMSFGLTNAPSTFMRLVNHVLSVLEILRKETLFANFEKCTFCTHEVVFLSFVIGSHGVKVDKEKVKAIQE
ncbi:hypothetical protein CR513_49051, partial [Mucuna pruriens]